LLASAHVDVGDLDGVVAVAEAVPGWNLGLHVAGCVGRAGAEAGVGASEDGRAASGIGDPRARA
jgi:hypothetical protein